MVTLVISYARVDRPQIRAVVALLRDAFRNVDRAVFWDGDLESGLPWYEQITRAIDQAPELFVFWCHHAATSTQVQREIAYALDRQKRVVPVLLDNTPLHPQLAPVQGIDLRGVLAHSQLTPAASISPPIRESARRANRVVEFSAKVFGDAGVALVAIVRSMWWTVAVSALSVIDMVVRGVTYEVLRDYPFTIQDLRLNWLLPVIVVMGLIIGLRQARSRVVSGIVVGHLAATLVVGAVIIFRSAAAWLTQRDFSSYWIVLLVLALAFLIHLCRYVFVQAEGGDSLARSRIVYRELRRATPILRNETKADRKIEEALVCTDLERHRAAVVEAFRPFLSSGDLIEHQGA